jgi:hypothetical protein
MHLAQHPDQTEAQLKKAFDHPVGACIERLFNLGMIGLSAPRNGAAKYYVIAK